jgi:hypothetical protein
VTTPSLTRVIIGAFGNVHCILKATHRKYKVDPLLDISSPKWPCWCECVHPSDPTVMNVFTQVTLLSWMCSPKWPYCCECAHPRKLLLWMCSPKETILVNVLTQENYCCECADPRTLQVWMCSPKDRTVENALTQVNLLLWMYSPKWSCSCEYAHPGTPTTLTQISLLVRMCPKYPDVAHPLTSNPAVAHVPPK